MKNYYVIINGVAMPFKAESTARVWYGRAVSAMDEGGEKVFEINTKGGHKLAFRRANMVSVAFEIVEVPGQ